MAIKALLLTKEEYPQGGGGLLILMKNHIPPPLPIYRERPLLIKEGSFLLLIN